MGYKNFFRRIDKVAVALIAIFFSLNCLSIFTLTTLTYNDLVANVGKTLNENTILQEEYLVAKIEKEVEILEGISEHLVIDSENFNIQLFLASIENASEFEYLTIGDLDGTTMGSDGRRPAILEKHMDIIMEMDYAIDVVSSNEEKKVILTIPIIEAGYVIGAASAEYDIEHFKEPLRTVLGDGGKSYIKNTSEVIISTEVSDYSNEKLLSDVVKANSNGLTTYLGDEKFLVNYQPLPINDWSLVTATPIALIEKEVYPIMYRLIAISVITFLFLVIMILHLIKSKQDSLRKIANIAYYDSLTGIRNVSKLKMDAKGMMAERPDEEFCLVKLDIVDFKVLNEIYSFNVGNQVIRAMSGVLKYMESIDKGNRVICARGDADTFYLFGLAKRFERFDEDRIHYETSFKHNLPDELANNHKFDFRYGRCKAFASECDIDDMINRVIMAHGSIKFLRNSSIRDYDDSFKEKAIKNTKITNKMQDALKNKDFKVYLQPKYDIATNKLVGAEALTRWIDPNGEMLSPSDFIPLFEKNGFITVLDNYVLETVCKILQDWISRGYECVPISINFSKGHLSQPKFVLDVLSVMREYKIPNHLIEIEMTETTMTENEHSLHRLLGELRENGLSVSMDDFGSGYSSLGMLKDFRIDTLKLDRSFFVSNIGDNSSQGDIVLKSVINMAQELGIKTVAEGVEYEEQVQFLQEIGCAAVQGYVFAKPMPVLDFEKHCWNENGNLL